MEPSLTFSAGDTPLHPRPLHPLLTVAAVSLTVFSLLAIGAISGLIPSASSQPAGDAAVAQSAAKGEAASPKPPSSRPACASCGVVESIRAIQSEGDASGLGAVAGGVTGALVGNQMGKGGGNTAMTLLGAAGGALAGNSIEKNMNRQTAYRITIRMDDGAYRTISQSHVPAVALGDKVKVVNGNVSAIP